MCQSVGCAAMSTANASASACVTAGTWSRSRPSGIGTGGLIACAQPFGVNQVAAGSSAAPVRRGEERGAARHARRLAEELHLDAAAGQVAVGDEADDPVLAQPLPEHVQRRALAAGEGQDLEAQTLAVLDEPVVQRFRLEPLGDRGESAVVLDQPQPGRVPVAHVRQGEDRAPSSLESGVQVLGPAHHAARQDGAFVHTRQAERLEPVPRVRAQRPRRRAGRDAAPTRPGRRRGAGSCAIAGRPARCGRSAASANARNHRSDMKRGVDFTSPQPAA